MTTKSESIQGIDGIIEAKKVENNTFYLKYFNCTTAYRLHFTDILTIHPDKSMILHSGGWLTVTTKDRLNKYLPLPWRIFQEKNVWYVWNMDTDKKYYFADGMTLYPHGIADTAEYNPKREKELNRVKNQINTYATGYIKKLTERKLSAPSGGDCWYCLMFNTNDIDHLKSHIQEKYYVPSLLANAVKRFQVSSMAMHCIGYWFKQHDQQGFSMGHMAQQVKKALVRYLREQFGLSA